ncbi:MAG: hypothetical protein K8F25_12415, partial [Fimbriimonadaceae bacterium]|nr:hypothetical protein [Alphaproteobacteria bacterium]
PPRGRGAKKTLSLGDGHVTLIDESYNANPASMAAALATLGQTAPGAGGRRIAVLGDMLELGDQACDLHAGLAENIRESHIDMVFTAGPLMKSLYNRLPASYRGAHADNSMHLIDEVTHFIRSGDVVMVKGSNGSRTFEIVEGIETYLTTNIPQGG